MIRNVLVTCGGGIQGLAILEGLRRIGGLRVVIVDSTAENIGSYFASAFRRAPLLADRDGYCDFLDDTIIAENIDFVVPATDLDLQVLASERARFAKLGAAIAVSEPDLLATLMDKRKTYAFCAEAGVRVLPEIELDPEIPVPFSVIAKPLRGFGSKGQHVLRAGDRPSKMAPGVDRSTHLWQRYIENATEYSVDFAIDMQGRVSPLAARERIANFSGFSILGQATGNSRLLEQARATAEHIARHGGHGGFNIQFLEHDGDPTLIDINARFGTSSSLALEMGLNLQAWLVGHPVEEPKRELRLIRYVTQASATTSSIDVSGIVFDLDDTLIDQKAWIAAKLRALHGTFSSRLPPKTDFLACALQLLEEGNRAYLIDGLIKQLGLPLSLRDVLIPAYREILPDQIEVYPDVVRVLDELRRRGIRIGLLSDNPAASQRQKLQRLQDILACSDLFDAVVLTDEIGAPKPDLRSYRAIANALDLPCNSIAMVGDNLFRDALGALRAGFSEAFLLQRRGTFFNFNPAILTGVPDADRVKWIDSLDQLLWHMPVTGRSSARKQAN